ncbi:hypothetical protein Pcinc_013858 [Petrolisthes cinctipes]|uniref:Uncharacterized protein n=1 Tax=Petrolisthes cinctipes TaxID=88211 RepID=A0AAE1G1L4_PETCI|nr:hypothetical protein Pcinc_013858 [Petrolisthes cinctipes]
MGVCRVASGGKKWKGGGVGCLDQCQSSADRGECRRRASELWRQWCRGKGLAASRSIRQCVCVDWWGVPRVASAAAASPTYRPYTAAPLVEAELGQVAWCGVVWTVLQQTRPLAPLLPQQRHARGANVTPPYLHLHYKHFLPIAVGTTSPFPSALTTTLCLATLCFTSQTSRPWLREGVRAITISACRTSLPQLALHTPLLTYLSPSIFAPHPTSLPSFLTSTSHPTSLKSFLTSTSHTTSLPSFLTSTSHPTSLPSSPLPPTLLFSSFLTSTSHPTSPPSSPLPPTRLFSSFLTSTSHPSLLFPLLWYLHPLTPHLFLPSFLPNTPMHPSQPRHRDEHITIFSPQCPVSSRSGTNPVVL